MEKFYLDRYHAMRQEQSTHSGPMPPGYQHATPDKYSSVDSFRSTVHILQLQPMFSFQSFRGSSEISTKDINTHTSLSSFG